MAAVAVGLLWQAPAADPVRFSEGPNHDAIQTAGFASLVLGPDPSQVGLSIRGVAGAAELRLMGLINITNQDADREHTVTLLRSGDVDPAIDVFTMSVRDGEADVVAWDAVASSGSGPFALPAATTYQVGIDYVVAEGTERGALSAFTIEALVAA